MRADIDLAHLDETVLLSVVSLGIVLVEELLDSLCAHLSLEVVTVLLAV